MILSHILIHVQTTFFLALIPKPVLIDEYTVAVGVKKKAHKKS